MARCTTENRADGCNDGWPYAVSFVAGGDGPMQRRQTLAEPREAIFRTAAGTAYRRERGEGMYCFSPSQTPRLPLGPRKCGCNIGATVSGPVCASQFAWAPRSKAVSPLHRKTARTRCTRDLSSMRPVRRVVWWHWWCGHRRSLGWGHGGPRETDAGECCGAETCRHRLRLRLPAPAVPWTENQDS